MKKVIILMVGLVFLLLGASSGVASEKRFHVQKMLFSVEYERKKAEVDYANKQFLAEVGKDIQQSLNLDLEGFEELDLAVLFKSNNEEYPGLTRLIFEIMLEQQVGDVQPKLYLNQNNVLILEKKADGSNIVHKYKFDNEKNKWEKTEKEKSEGSQIIHPLERLSDPPAVNKMNFYLRNKFHTF